MEKENKEISFLVDSNLFVVMTILIKQVGDAVA